MAVVCAWLVDVAVSVLVAMRDIVLQMLVGMADTCFSSSMMSSVVVTVAAVAGVVIAVREAREEHSSSSSNSGVTA